MFWGSCYSNDVFQGSFYFRDESCRLFYSHDVFHGPFIPTMFFQGPFYSRDGFWYSFTPEHISECCFIAAMITKSLFTPTKISSPINYSFPRSVLLSLRVLSVILYGNNFWGFLLVRVTKTLMVANKLNSSLLHTEFTPYSQRISVTSNSRFSQIYLLVATLKLDQQSINHPVLNINLPGQIMIPSSCELLHMIV